MFALSLGRKEIAINKYVLYFHIHTIYHMPYTVSIYFSEARKITSPSAAYLSLTRSIIEILKLVWNC